MDKYRGFCVDIYFIMLKNSCLHNSLDKLAVLIDLMASGKCSQDQGPLVTLAMYVLYLSLFALIGKKKNQFLRTSC